VLCIIRAVLDIFVCLFLYLKNLRFYTKILYKFFYLLLQRRFPDPKCPILMKLTGNVVFKKTFDTYFFITAKFHSEGVKMGVKVWGDEIHIWSNISETITDRKKV